MLVVIITSLLELDQVAKFTLGDECKSLNQILHDYPQIGSLLPAEPTCFGVAPTLAGGYWLAVIAIIMTNLFGGFVMCAAHVALEEHKARANSAA